MQRSIHLATVLCFACGVARAEDPVPRFQPLATVSAHTHRVQSLAFSPDGRLLVTGGGRVPGEVKVWDVRTRRMVRSLEVKDSMVRAVAVSPGGRLLAAGGGTWSDPGKIVLWDLASGKELRRIAPSVGPVHSLAFSPDGKRLAAASGRKEGDQTFGGLELFEPATGKFVRSIPLAGPVSDVAFSPDGAHLAATEWHFGDGVEVSRTHVWSLAKSEPAEAFYKLSGVTRKNRCLGYSPDGKLLAVAGRIDEDTFIRIRQVAAGGDWAQLETHPGLVWSVAFSPDGRWLAGGESSPGVVRIWNVQSGKQAAALKVDTFDGGVLAVRFSPDGKTLVAGGTNANQDTGPLAWWSVVKP